MASTLRQKTIQDQLQWAMDSFKSSGIETARLDAEVLLASVLKKSREDIIKEPEQPLTEEQAERFEECVARRCNKEPVAYITGKREFWSMDFKVTPDVLIPRPDTEIMLEAFFKLCPDPKASPKVLDVGTGSGAIAVVVKKERPHTQVTATDISEQALAIARENASSLCGSDGIRFIQAEGLNESRLAEGVFDFILSNPPYVAPDSPDLSPEVEQYEPRLAWDGGEDGLDFYRTFLPSLPKFLAPGGTCLLEIGYDQADSIRAITLTHDELSFEDVVPDYAGRDRVVILKRKMHG